MPAPVSGRTSARAACVRSPPIQPPPWTRSAAGNGPWPGGVHTSSLRLSPPGRAYSTSRSNRAGGGHGGAGSAAGGRAFSAAATTLPCEAGSQPSAPPSTAADVSAAASSRAERPRPGDARAGARSRARRAVLGVAGRLLALRPAPVVPALRPDDLRHLGAEEDGAGEGAPGPAEVRPHLGRLAAQRAAREDEAVRLLLRRRGGGDVAVPPGDDRAAVEEGGGAAEDEVDVAGDEAALEVLPAAVEEHGVLPADEPAVAEGGPVAVDADRQRLAHRAGRVLEGQALGGEVVGVDLGRGGAERPDRLAVGARHVGVEVERDDRLLRVLADEGQEALLALDVEALPVGARPDVDDPGASGAAGGRGRDRVLEGVELAAAVRGHDGVRVGGPAGGEGGGGGRGESGRGGGGGGRAFIGAFRGTNGQREKRGVRLAAHSRRLRYPGSAARRAAPGMASELEPHGVLQLPAVVAGLLRVRPSEVRGGDGQVCGSAQFIPLSALKASIRTCRRNRRLSLKVFCSVRSRLL